METKLQKNIQQYIELVYSEKSPLIQIINLDERKTAACKQLGIDPKSESVRKVIDLKDEKSRDMIIEYMCKNESNELIDLMSDQHLFLEIQVLKMTPLIPSDDEEKMMKAINMKTTMSMKSKELLEKMNASYIRIFKGPNEVTAAKKRVNWVTLEQRIKKRDEQKEKEKTNAQ